VTIGCYNEEGSTTTPFDMMIRNNVSRYDVAIHAIRAGGQVNSKVAPQQHELVSNIKHTMNKTQEFILETGTG